MKYGYKHFIATVVTLVLVAFMPFALPATVQPVGAQNVDCYMQQGGAKFVCDNGGEIELQTGAVLDIQSGATASIDDLTIADDLIVADDFTLTDDGTVAGTIRYTPSTTQTITMNGAIAATSAVNLLSSAGTVNTSNVGCGSNGDLVTYINVGAQSIVISDTSTLKLAGNITLGATDSLTLQNVWNNCIQVSQANN